jgi:hypothetical protein
VVLTHHKGKHIFLNSKKKINKEKKRKEKEKKERKEPKERKKKVVYISIYI